MKAYIASGWFSKKQEKARQAIKWACGYSGLDYYSPKDNLLYDPDTDNPKTVFDVNIEEICSASLVIASTVGKDMGTLFECGVAWGAGVPIVYYFKGSTFNLMLAESAMAILSTRDELYQYLHSVVENQYVFSYNMPYKGGIE